jgi:hypothetical protein
LGERFEKPIRVDRSLPRVVRPLQKNSPLIFPANPLIRPAIVFESKPASHKLGGQGGRNAVDARSSDN